MTKKDFADFWDKRRKINQNRQSCLITVKRTTIQVAAPKSLDFEGKANAMGGRWRPRSWVWVFRMKQLSAVQEACAAVFGSYKLVFEVPGPSDADDPGPQISPEPPPEDTPPWD